MSLPIAGFAPTVVAQASLDQPSSVLASGLSAAQLFALADQAKSDHRNEDALALYAALARDPDADVRAEARFRRGLLLARSKRYADAALAFRSVLDEKPAAARVRLELARVLALMGDEAAARRAVREAQAIGLPDDVAATVDQFARALRSVRPFGGSVQVALAPDSNINRATQARTLDTVIAPLTLSRDARAQSGVGVRLAGQGFARLPITDTLSALSRASVLGSFYRDGGFDDVSASALIGLEWRRGRDRWSPSVGLTRRWYGGSPYALTRSVTLDWLHPLGRQAQLVLHGGAAASRYVRNELQDGGLFDLAASYERASSARSGFGVTLSGYRQTARDPGYATISGGITLSSWRDVGKTTFLVTTGASTLEGDARLFLFPDRRREWLVNSSVSATLRQLSVAGFAPSLRLSLEQNRSSVGLYQYRRAAGDIGIVRAF
jgi:tetratricopeptide (TPR) repeat protein